MPGPPFGNRIAERAAADRHFARIVRDISAGKTARALKRLVRNADVIRTAPDLEAGRDLRGTPTERLQAATGPIQDKPNPGPAVFVKSNRPLDAPWPWMHPGVEQLGSISTPVNTRPHFTEFEADFIKRRDRANKEAAQVRLSRSGQSQSTPASRERLIAHSLQGGHGSSEWEALQAARRAALKSPV
jgi:hypothetical protein